MAAFPCSQIPNCGVDAAEPLGRRVVTRDELMMAGNGISEAGTDRERAEGEGWLHRKQYHDYSNAVGVRLTWASLHQYVGCVLRQRARNLERQRPTRRLPVARLFRCSVAVGGSTHCKRPAANMSIRAVTHCRVRRSSQTSQKSPASRPACP
ncbi:hypothetical protein BT67DRAFT_105815 [Trichocladium antarcticum]|uniref:Uncharacterized protein n=1 Tax=Trichocladium antarcticum TaxID=1450529 RepID=A0AAN6UQI0_9PEZI|nr:hypothetical protein BT67DRAFT_105815 [Trichocladium antarcticum]